MSKLDIGVGDEFPLDEGQQEPRRGHRHGRYHFRHHHMHHRHHHHHLGHGLVRFAILLIVAGLAVLIVEHRLPAEAAYGMIGLGVAGVVTMTLLHRRHHHQSQQAS